MAGRQTIFYSWQSDTPARLNRTFIEDALHQAIKALGSDAEVAAALRDEPIHLDKDTEGVPGSPPIAATILQKIDACAVFVADLTFVGQSMESQHIKKARQFPNPNVAIEYGYALKSCGHERIVAVMNAHFGEPSNESLPFDLRHLRWPVTFNLNDGDDEKAEKRRELASALARQLKPILVAQKAEKKVPRRSNFKPAAEGIRSSIYFDRNDVLVPEQPFGKGKLEAIVPQMGHLFLRVHPAEEVAPFSSELKAREVAEKGGLWPMGAEHGANHVRNKFGAISYEYPHEGNLWNLTQLFLSREIWGVDAYSINNQTFKLKTGGSFVRPLEVEQIFSDTLRRYLAFARQFLELDGPLNVIAGLVDVQHHQLAIGTRFRGPCFENQIIWRGETATSKPEDAADILKVFFDLIWEKFGTIRSIERQLELKQSLGLSH